MPVNRRAVSALVLAETISVLGTRMTYLALPWFVLVTTGSPGKMSLVLAAEILPMAILGVPSGALVATTRLEDDDAHRRLRARADPRLDSAAVRGRESSASGSCSRSSRCSERSRRRTSPPSGRSSRSSSARTRRACRRRTARSKAARALAALLGPRSPARSSRSSALRTCCTSTLRPISSRSSSFSGSCLVGRRRPRLRSTACSRACGSSCRDKLLGPLAATITVFGFLAAGMSAGLPVYAYDEFDGSSWIAGLFYAALGAGAVVGSVLAVFAVARSHRCAWPRSQR